MRNHYRVIEMQKIYEDPDEVDPRVDDNTCSRCGEDWDECICHELTLEELGAVLAKHARRLSVGIKIVGGQVRLLGESITLA